MDRKKYLLLLKYIANAYIRTFLFSVPFTLLFFIILLLSGMYSRLDLKFDSPVLVLPMLASLVLAAVVLVFGSILYVYKYRRTIDKTAFYKAVAAAMEEENNTTGKDGKNK